MLSWIDLKFFYNLWAWTNIIGTAQSLRNEASDQGLYYLPFILQSLF